MDFGQPTQYLLIASKYIQHSRNSLVLQYCASVHAIKVVVLWLGRWGIGEKKSQSSKSLFKILIKM